MNFNERQIAPPTYWQKFEDVCLSIFRNAWVDPTAQKNGRVGQPQHGTDIYGYAGGALQGVQCKGKTVGYGATVSETELRDEVAKARNFTPALSHWILATTAPKDAGIEQVAREINAEHEKTGLFRVRVLGWEDLQSLMAAHTAVIEEHYPDQAPTILLTLKRLADTIASAPADLPNEVTTAKEAAENDLAKFLAAETTISAVRLSLEITVEDRKQPTSHADVLLALQSGGTTLLEAEPGAGKSATLRQFVGALLTEGTIAAIVLLPELAITRRDLLDELSNRSSFRQLGRDALFHVAQAGRLVLLCDGWNELPGDQRQQVALGLAKFRREFPHCGLMVATRALSPQPLRDSSRIALLPATRTQQLAILRERLGPAAEALLAEARRTPGLRDLLGTPLYVSVLADSRGNGRLPATKEEAIRRFIENQESRAGHMEVLRERLHDLHRHYLRAIGRLLTNEGKAAITEPDLRREITAEEDRLAEDRQLIQKLDPQNVIDTLVSHHVLVERAHSASEHVYSFQHQQFQEWFASFHVEDCMVATPDGTAPGSVEILDRLLDRPEWTEPILFAIERLSRASVEGAQCVGHAILRALRIDPMLAATMINRATVEAWVSIAEPVSRFAAAWYSSDDRDRAFRFMAVTGRHEFAEPLWEIIANKEAYDRSAGPGFVWLAPAALGPNAQTQYAQLPADQRRSLLWDLALYGGQAGIDFAINACRTEPSAEVVGTVLDILEDRGTESEFTSLLQIASDEVWGRLALRHALSDTSGEFRVRLLREKKALAATGQAADKLRLRLELTAAGEYDDPNGIVALVFEGKAGDYHSEYTTLARVAALYPDHLSRAIIERLVRGEPVAPIAACFVKIGSPEQQETLLGIALGEIPRDGRAKELAGRALNQESAHSLIRRLIAVLNKPKTGDRTAMQTLGQKHQAITDALNVLHHDMLVPTLLAAPIEQPRYIATLAELLYRWRSDDREHDHLLADDVQTDRLCQALADWVERLIHHRETSRHDLMQVATAIKRVARPSLLPALTQLLSAELEAWCGDRLELEQQRSRGPRTTRANTIYTSIYRQAIEVFTGEAVRDLCLSYIGNADFEVEAAFALRQYGTSERIPSPADSIGWPKYERIPIMQARREQQHVRTSPVATVILDRVDALMVTGSSADLGRAIGLATAVAQMDCGDRIGSINAVAAAPGPMSPRYGLLQVLLFAGGTISATWVLRGFEEELESIRSQHWRSQNDWWVIERWLELMAFTDAPDSMIAPIANLPVELKHAHNFDRVVSALGHAAPGPALRCLLALTEQIPPLRTRHYFGDALVKIGSLAAITELISLSFDPLLSSPSGHSWLSLANVLTETLEKHPSAKEELLTRVLGLQRSSLTPAIMQVLPAIIDQKDVLRLLQLCGPSGGDSMSRVVVQGVEKLAVIDRPIEGTNAYERDASDLSWMRSELFQIYLKKGPLAAFAAKLLGIIDRQRDMYGRSLSEPRHPDISSGAPWPEVAGVI
jgi:hypothetical protein